MKIKITIDVDLEDSGIEADDIMNNATEWVLDLILPGAEEQGIGMALCEVELLVPEQ